MIHEPGDANQEITITKTFHLQTDDELSEKELKQFKADDQAIQTILLGLPKDIYAVVDKSSAAATRAPRSQYDFVDIVETGQITAYEMELQERQSAKDLAVTQMMRIHALKARAQTNTVEDADSSY
nr:hypothetical protein [Tanacetum cinerariifolium]